MTLIAGLVPNGSPMLLGDVLLSGDGSIATAFRAGPNEMMLPSKGITDTSTGIQARSLASKIAIINDDFAIAWAGCFQSAKRLITHIYDQARTGVHSIDEINDYFSTAEYDDILKTKLILLFKSASDLNDEIGWRMEWRNTDLEFNHTIFGNVRCAGSGARLLQRTLEDFASDQMEGLSNASQNNGLVGFGKSMMLAGHLLTTDLSSDDPVRNNFGGGFEIAYIGENGIKKMSDITYIFWQMNEDWNRLALIPIIVNVKYEGDLLIIKRCQGVQARNIPISSDHRNYGMNVFGIGPIYRDFQLSEFESVMDNEFNSAHQCHFVLIPNNNDPIFSYFCDINAKQLHTKFEWKDDRLDIAIHDEFRCQVEHFFLRNRDAMISSH